MNHYDKSVPSRGTLTHFSGTVESVRRVNDLTSMRLGFDTPFDSVQFTLAGAPEVFEYASALPRGDVIYQRLAYEVDVWVDKRVQGANAPLRVYRLEQRVPAQSTLEPIVVEYDDAATVLEANHRSYERLGAILLVAAAVFFVVAKLADIWNRHRHEFAP